MIDPTGERLQKALQHVGQATAALAVMLERRRISRSSLREVREDLVRATASLTPLIDD